MDSETKQKLEKLETILNKFISMWRKPRQKEGDIVSIEVWNNDRMTVKTEKDLRFWANASWEVTSSPYSVTELCGIDSDFWQFVCVKLLHWHWNDDFFVMDENEYDSQTPEYWIAKSSIQRDKVQFILDVIKLDNETI